MNLLLALLPYLIQTVNKCNCCRVSEEKNRREAAKCRDSNTTTASPQGTDAPQHHKR